MGPTGDSPDENTVQKRPATSSGNTNGRASKRRAARACLSCRNRKVRCDVVNVGQPCTNCRLDNVQCFLKESNRGRRAVATFSPTSESSAPPVQQALTDRPDDHMVSLTFEDLRSPTPAVEDLGQVQIHHPPDMSNLEDTTNHSDISLNLGDNQRLPSFIRPLPHHIGTRDLEYLADKGALTIPDGHLRDELLRLYVTIVHPFMPALDVQGFLAPILNNDGQSNVSLLLFQAVMFVSITFVDAQLLQCHGYKSRRAARKIFFNRVRLLYGLDCESDRLILVQALLLMTYWYDNPNDEKDTWYWMGITLSLAQVAGLHRDPGFLNITIEEKRLRRRIWWSCVTRDRLLALGIRRPTRIEDKDFSVTKLVLDDFNLDTRLDALGKLLGEPEYARPNSQTRTTLAIMCIELNDLCICLGQILHSQYTILGDRSNGSDFFLTPKKSVQQIQELSRCDTSLLDWFERQDIRSKYASDRPAPRQICESTERIIMLHQALLHMIYQTVQGVLHKPQAFYSADANDRELSRKRVTEAAVSVTRLAFDLESNNQIRYLSTSSVPAFLSASLIHLLDIRDPSEETRNISIGRFYQCLQVLYQLQDMYASADYAIRFLETVLRKTDIRVPMLRLKDSSRQVSLVGSRTMPDTATRERILPSSRGSSNIRDQVASNNPRQANMAQPSNPLLDTFDVWSITNNTFGNDLRSSDMDMSSSYPSTWCDVDSLIPTLMSFNADSNRL